MRARECYAFTSSCFQLFSMLGRGLVRLCGPGVGVISCNWWCFDLLGTYCFALAQDRSRSLQLRPWACVLVRESQVGALRGGVALLPACPVDLRCAGVRVVEYPGKVACPSGRRCSTRNAVWCHSHPGFKSQRYRHCRPAPMGPGGFVMPEWFPGNVARNSRTCILGFEIRSLELQRLWAVSKNDRVKLRATFGGVVTAVTFGHLYWPRAPLLASGTSTGRGPLCQARPFIGPAPLHLQGCRRGGTPKGPASAACV